MNKLLKSVRSSTNQKDEILKNSIINQLSDSIKEIHYAIAEENKSPSPTSTEFSISEAANTLCSCIEALLLHGLRDTLTHRFKKALADVDEQPEPSFWPPLLVISHRQIIDQITHLSQITTEVGQCRAWIRLALNDCLLSSYLMTIRQDSSSLKSYYRVNALIRDSELLEVAQRLIEGVEAFKTFTLPFNSSLLNTWPLPSIILAGIWAPTLKSAPVAPCDDVAQTITESSKSQANFESSSDTASVCSVLSYSSQSSGLRQIVSLSEDEVLKIILAKDEMRPMANSNSAEDIKSSCSSKHDESSDLDSNVNYNVGNSLSQRTGWSFDESQSAEGQDSKSDLSKHKSKETDDNRGMDTSFNALIESYNMLSGGFIKTPDFREIWQKFEEERKGEQETIKIEAEESNVIVASSPKTEISFTEQIGRIAREKGLDAQNYECMDCRQSLGIEKKPKTCAFTGNYFCDKCMSEELIPIPARIIHNWDFKPYSISQKGINHLNEVKDHPIIDFKVLNPYIYGSVVEMAHLQILRNQLNFLRAYLFSCREPIIEELQKQLWPREYMYEHIHLYSVLDLLDVTNGMLAQQLEKVVNFGREHVYTCWLCSQKGFVCEVCNKPKPLFPFDVESVYRCNDCSGVYHKSCLNSTKPCPKCKRRKKREELPLLGAITID